MEKKKVLESFVQRTNESFRNHDMTQKTFGWKAKSLYWWMLVRLLYFYLPSGHILDPYDKGKKKAVIEKNKSSNSTKIYFLQHFIAKTGSS